MPYKKLLIFIIISIFVIPTQKVNSALPVSLVNTIPVNDMSHKVVNVGNAGSSATTAGEALWTTARIIAEETARATMRRAIRSLTNATVNWINNGFEGNPAFVTDPGQFFLDVADEGASQFLSQAGINNLCQPFKAEVRLALVKNYLSETSGNNYTCTLTKLKNNYDAFIGNFENGGWEGWFELTQNDQNNAFGAYASARQQLSIQVGAGTEQKKTQLTQGNGFLSFERCKKEYVVTQTMINDDFLQGGTMIDEYQVGDCLKKAGAKEIATPGKVIETQLEGALGTGLRQMELADSVDKIIAALVAQLFERVLQSGKGLLDNNNPNDPNNTLPLPEPGFGVPIILINGLSPTYIQVGTVSVYRDTGAKAYDELDGDITSSIVATGRVNPLVIGTYRITYNVTNSAGVSAVPVTRLVIVSDDSVDPETLGGQCADTGNRYAGELRAAMDAVIAANPSVANLPNIEDSSSGRGMKANARQLLDLVATYINSNMSGFSATADVLNGNNNTSTGDIIAIWKTGDTLMERYDAILGDDTITVGEATITDFVGFIPLDCTGTGGGTDCGCRTTTGGEDSEEGNGDDEPTINPNPGDGKSYISLVSPSSAKPGVTTLTITGDNLTNQVSFYDGSGNRNTVVGTVNSTRTQTTVLVPDGQPIGNATVKIYRGNQVWSNGKLIQVSETGGGGIINNTVTPSVNATSGWLGSAAHNSTNNTWMVISGGVFGRIMGNNLTPITPEFKLNTNTASDIQVLGTKVAYSPNINKYLAVWVAFDGVSTPNQAGTIYGRFVNPDGTFFGNVFQIFKDYPGSGATAFYANSILQYDGKNKKFVMVWVYDGVKLVTVSESGVPGIPIQVVSGMTAGYLPSVAVSERNDEYCVAYDKRSDVPRKVATKKVNSATLVIGPENSLSAPGEYSSIVYNSFNNQYLVAWNENGTTKGRILRSCNINDVSGSGFTIQSKGGTAVLAYNSKSNTYASIVQNQNDSGNTYNILSATGAKIKEGLAFSGGFGNFSPTIIANTTDGTFAATSALEYATTRFAPNLGATGVGGGTGSMSTPIKKDLGVGTFPDPVFHNGRIYVAVQQNDKLNLYNWDKNLGDQKVQEITFSGVGQAFPRLAVNNSTLWMVFRNGNNSPGSSVPESIKLWRMDTNTMENLGNVTNSGNDPVAIGNGYVAWQNEVSGVIKVYRRSISGGTPMIVRDGGPTGISRILTGGSVVLIDTDRTAVTWGLNAWFAGTLTVAADVTPYDDNGVVGRFGNVASTEFNIWPNERTQTPHAATDGSGNYVIATWNPTVRIASFSKSQ